MTSSPRLRRKEIAEDSIDDWNAFYSLLEIFAADYVADAQIVTENEIKLFEMKTKSPDKILQLGSDLAFDEQKMFNSEHTASTIEETNTAKTVEGFGFPNYHEMQPLHLDMTLFQHELVPQESHTKTNINGSTELSILSADPRFLASKVNEKKTLNFMQKLVSPRKESRSHHAQIEDKPRIETHAISLHFPATTPENTVDLREREAGPKSPGKITQNFQLLPLEVGLAVTARDLMQQQQQTPRLQPNRDRDLQPDGDRDAGVKKPPPLEIPPPPLPPLLADLPPPSLSADTTSPPLATKPLATPSPAPPDLSDEKIRLSFFKRAKNFFAKTFQKFRRRTIRRSPSLRNVLNEKGGVSAGNITASPQEVSRLPLAATSISLHAGSGPTSTKLVIDSKSADGSPTASVKSHKDFVSPRNVELYLHQIMNERDEISAGDPIKRTVEQANSLKTIAYLHLQKESFSEAKFLFTRALTSLPREPKHTNTLIACLCGLAAAQNGLKDHVTAISTFDEAHQLTVRLLGPTHRKSYLVKTLTDNCIRGQFL